MRNIVVIGSDHVNTLGIIRSLGEAGEKPTAVITTDESKCWTAKSKYIDRLIITPHDKEKMVEALMQAKNDSEKAYLIPAGDPYSKLIDDNFDLLSRYYILPNVNETAGELSRIMNKKPMSEAASDIGGFRLAETLYYQVPESGDFDSVPELAEIEKYYPLIMRNGESFINADGNIYIVKDRAEFYAALEKKRGITVIIQQFINKDEEIGVQGVGFGKDKEPVVAGIIHKIRTAKVGSIGSTTYATVAPPQVKEIVEATKKFISGVGYDGIFDIELLRQGDNYYFVECNFRNGAYGYAFTKAGANLPMIWADRNIGKEYQIKEMTLMNETADMKHIGKEVSPFKWLSQFCGADIHLTLSKKDVKPFIGRILSK